MIYCFDIDGTICSSVNNSNYEDADVFPNMLEKINSLFDDGHTIYFMTARGSVSGKDWTQFTQTQLQNWGFKYHKLITNQKPHAHYFIDDKACNAIEWAKKNTNIKKGVIAGAFDIIHPGYIHMFKESLKHCNHLTVCLHEDPSYNNKMKPILNLEERIEILQSLKFIDEIITYKTEQELDLILKTNCFDVRILGEDYVNKTFTGSKYCKETIFVSRQHGWSATKFKKIIYENFKDKK